MHNMNCSILYIGVLSKAEIYNSILRDTTAEYGAAVLMWENSSLYIQDS